MIFVMATVEPKLPTPMMANAELPMEFSLRLGPQSPEQLAEVARKLRLLGADVQIDGDGSLVAFRPL